MKLFIFFIATLVISSFTITPGKTWLTNFEQAKLEASQAKKCILLNFSGSDWCMPCIRLKSEIFSSETFTAFAGSNLVLANADFPRLKKNQLDKNQMQHNEALAEKYNPHGKFPLTILLDSYGTVIRQWEGIPQKSPELFVDELKKLLDAEN